MNRAVSRKQKLDVKILSKFTSGKFPNTQALHSNVNKAAVRLGGWVRGRLVRGGHQHPALQTAGPASAVGSLPLHTLQQTRNRAGDQSGGPGEAEGRSGNQQCWGKCHHTSHYRGTQWVWMGPNTIERDDPKYGT